MKFYSPFSHCWYSINQHAREGADIPHTRLYGDDLNHDKNLYVSMEVCFGEGFVSCWRPLLDSIDSLLCILMNEQTFSLRWLYIYQMAGKGAEYPCVQLLSVDPQNNKNLDGKVEHRFDEGFVSCWSTFLDSILWIVTTLQNSMSFFLIICIVSIRWQEKELIVSVFFRSIVITPRMARTGVLR